MIKGNFNTEVLVRAIRYALDRKQSEQALSAATQQLGLNPICPPPARLTDELVNDFAKLLAQMADQNSLALSELGNDNPARIYVEKLDQTIHLANALTQRLFATSK